MYIHNYQIHNVLNVYQRQLTQGVAKGKENAGSKSQVSSQLSYKRDRQTIIEKVASSVLEKINLLDTETQNSDKLSDVSRNPEKKQELMDSKKSKDFSFNMIDQNNQKITSSISVDKSERFIYRLNEITTNEGLTNNKITIKSEDAKDSNINIKI